MRRIPTAADIDAMSEEELEAYIDHAAYPAPGQVAAGGRQCTSQEGQDAATGAPRGYAWLLIVCGLLGVGSSWELMLSELSLLRNPNASLVCDINPLVSCGASLDTWQGNLLGVPNSFVGVAAFSVLVCLGVLLASGVRLPRWVWRGMSLACVVATVFVMWFLEQSVVVFAKLCPLCMIVWAVTIPVAVRTWVQAGIAGHLGRPGRAWQRAWQARWWVVGALYGIVLAVVVLAFWDAWVALLA